MPDANDPAINVLRAWMLRIRDDPALLAAIRAGGQVEVRLFTHRHETRKDPVIILNNGPSTMQ